LKKREGQAGQGDGSSVLLAILLAAGFSSRMGSDKLLLSYKGLPLLQHSIDLLCKLPADERILVTNETRLVNVIVPENVKVVINAEPEKGQSESIRLGIEATQAASAISSHFLFLQADQPNLTADDITPLLDAAEANPAKIIFPITNNQPNSPTLFPVKYRYDLLNLSGDNGGRIIREKSKEHSLGIEVDKPANFSDIDCMEDLNGFV